MLTDVKQRLMLHNLLNGNTNQDDDLIRGFSQQPKIIAPKYFYDDIGSQLFLQICDLPEYYLTRTETAILQQYAHQIPLITKECELVELGSGGAIKTRLLLDAYQTSGCRLRYSPVDVSAEILENSSIELLKAYPKLEINAFVSTYELALEKLPPSQLSHRMICFIGSSLGNLTPLECDRFFSEIFNCLKPKDYFLLGIDLQKPIPILEAAYNDSQGITAAFNLNILQHLNNRYHSNFDITNFKHIAIYNPEIHQIEMYLESLKSQSVELKKHNLTIKFEQGESILTEISRKFNLDQLSKELTQHGLEPVKIWTDDHQWFGLILTQRA